VGTWLRDPAQATKCPRHKVTMQEWDDVMKRRTPLYRIDEQKRNALSAES